LIITETKHTYGTQATAFDTKQCFVFYPTNPIISNTTSAQMAQTQLLVPVLPWGKPQAERAHARWMNARIHTHLRLGNAPQAGAQAAVTQVLHNSPIALRRCDNPVKRYHAWMSHGRQPFSLLKNLQHAKTQPQRSSQNFDRTRK
jgi:hypothetical protein